VRVLHFIYDDRENPWVAGGGAVRAFEIYRRLTGRINVTVVTGNFPGAAAGVVDGVEYVRVGARSPYAWSRLTYALGANRCSAVDGTTRRSIIPRTRRSSCPGHGPQAWRSTTSRGRRRRRAGAASAEPWWPGRRG